jgi:ferredoxin
LTATTGLAKLRQINSLGGCAIMRIAVDLNRCQSYAQCCFLAPDTFKLHGEEALIYNPAPDAAQRDQILRAAAACPVQAILVDQGDDRSDSGGRAQP